MIVSFRYSTPINESKQNPSMCYRTPNKVKKFYESIPMHDTSAKQQFSNLIQRSHKLQPSLKPLGLNDKNFKSKQLDNREFKAKGTYSYMFDINDDHIEEEIDGLKNVLQNLVNQERNLTAQIQINKMYYNEILQKLQKDEASIGEKARQLKEQIVNLRLQMRQKYNY